MVGDFLELGSLEASELKIRPDRIDLGSLAGEILENFKGLAETQGIALSEKRFESPIWVMGDRRRLTQVITNLLSNAIKFTPSGGSVEVQVAAHDETAKISVKDTGRGIPSEAIPGLFKRYARVLDDAEKISGTGLGLMIVREIVEAHGGTVGARSVEGRGSTFFCTFPKAP
jgi:signal transduction histidine kinase